MLACTLTQNACKRSLPRLSVAKNRNRTETSPLFLLFMTQNTEEGKRNAAPQYFKRAYVV
jgi:hypothetical protein